MNLLNVLEQVIVLFLIMAIGFVARKLGVMDNHASKGFSNLLLKIALPALIIDSLQEEFSPELLSESGQILVISFFVYTLSALAAWATTRFLATPSGEVGVLRFAILFSNVGFMGYPVVLAVLGEAGLFYAAIYNLPFNLLVFTLGVLVLSLGREEGAKISWRMFLNPAIVSVIIGFLLFVFSVQLTGPIGLAVSQLGGLTTPLSMILVGAMLANLEWRVIFSNWRVYVVALMRVLLIPLGVWAILRLFVTNPMLIAVPTLLASMPVATNAVLLAEEYQANPALASQVIFISTVLSVVTIPVLVYFLF